MNKTNIKTTQQRAFLLILTVFVMVTSLFNTGTVFADDNVPPIGPVATEVPIVNDVAPLLKEETLPTLTDQVVSEPDPVSEVLKQLPEDTQLIVLDNNGDVLPLATQGAAKITAASDPIWCSDSITPDPTDPNCSPSFTSMTALITWLTTNDPNTAGTIWIEDSYDSGSNVTDTGLNFILDGTTLTNMAGNSLTIQGGWNGVVDNATISGSSEFNGYLHITNWGENITANNLVFNSTSGIGLNINTTQNIDLNNIQSSNNADSGADLAGADITVSGDNIFNNNSWAGLVIDSSGDVLVNNISANSNHVTGAIIENWYAGTGNVTLTGTNTFSNNDGHGLFVDSNGNIQLNNITGTMNTGSGAVIYNENSGTGNIIIDNSTLTDNKGNGLFIASYGDVILSNITASVNNASGASLDIYGGNIFISSSQFNSNANYGINAKYATGALYLNTVSFDCLNKLGDYYYNNTVFHTCESIYETGQYSTVDSGSLSLNFVFVSDNKIVQLDCEQFSGTTLALPNKNHITFKCPIEGSGSLGTLAKDSLPGNLPEGVEYVSGMQATQSPNRSDKALDGQVVISFIIPEDMQNADLAILYWDGSQWVDLKSASFEDGRVVINGGYVTGDGYFEAVTNFSGNFVLVAK